jgi:hypothetical protein
MNEILTKVCFKCNEQKELKDFYTHPKMKDGYLGKCKICTKLDTKITTKKLISTPDGLEKERQRHREKYYRLNYKDKHKQSFENKKLSSEKHRNKYPEKYIAKILSQRVKLLNKNNHRHHWNYNIEFAKDIIELSIKDHSKIHRFIKYDKKTFMYKDLNGNLLNTKEKHIELINKILVNF